MNFTHSVISTSLNEQTDSKIQFESWAKDVNSRWEMSYNHTITIIAFL